MLRSAPFRICCARFALKSPQPDRGEPPTNNHTYLRILHVQQIFAYAQEKTKNSQIADDLVVFVISANSIRGDADFLMTAQPDRGHRKFDVLLG